MSGHLGPVTKSSGFVTRQVALLKLLGGSWSGGFPMNDHRIVPHEYGNPLRPDGSVLVPPHIADKVLRLLMIALRTAQRANAGGIPARDVVGILRALHIAAIKDAEQASSASGTEESKSVSVKVRESPVLAFPGQWVSCSDAAALLECSPRSVRKACEQGRLPATKTGRQWLITKDALDTYRFTSRRQHGSARQDAA